MLLMELLRSLYVTYQSSLLHEEMNRVHRTSDIDLTDHANTRRVARERSLSLGDQSLPAPIREREKILPVVSDRVCLLSSRLTLSRQRCCSKGTGSSRPAATCTELEFLNDGGGRVQEGQDEELGNGGSNNTARLSPIGTPNRWTVVQSDGAADATFSVPSIRPYCLSCLATCSTRAGAGLSSTTAAAPAFLHPSPAGGRIGLLSLGGGGAVPPLLGSPARLAGQQFGE